MISIWLKQTAIIAAVGGVYVLAYFGLPASEPEPTQKLGAGIELVEYLFPLGTPAGTDSGGNELEQNLIVIHTTPPGARISIRTPDKRYYVGLSPVQTSILPGALSIDVALAGHRTTELYVDASDRGYWHSIDIRLEKDPDRIDHALRTTSSTAAPPPGYDISYVDEAEELVITSRNVSKSIQRVVSPPILSGSSFAFTSRWNSASGSIRFSAFGLLTDNELILTAADGVADTSLMWPLGRFGLARTGNNVAVYDLALSKLTWQLSVPGDFSASRFHDMLILRSGDDVRVYDAFSGQPVWLESTENPDSSTSITLQ